MKVGYFPGCSLHGTSREFDASTRVALAALGVELEEIDDWNCCGASSAHALSGDLAVALGARNLLQANRQGLEQVLCPCAACYSRLALARHELGHDVTLRAEIESVLDGSLESCPKVINLLQLLAPLGDQIRQSLERPLGGLKVACYYGCLLVRPPDVVQFDDPEQPQSMEELAKILGAEPVDWTHRMECCGAGFSLSRRASVVRRANEILAAVKHAGADAVLTACPMCHSNLDMRQALVEQTYGQRYDLPVIFVTQTLGLGLGLGPELELRRHFVDAERITHRALKAAEQ